MVVTTTMSCTDLNHNQLAGHVPQGILALHTPPDTSQAEALTSSLHKLTRPHPLTGQSKARTEGSPQLPGWKGQ